MLAQEYPKLEYIVMDGGSTDETASVVKDYSSRLTWISEKDRGQSHAINKGFQIAKGGIVAWLNSDDTILPGAVDVAVRAFSETPDAGAVYGEGYRLDKEGTVTGRFPYTEPFNLWKLAHLSDYILQQTVYFRRSVFDEVGFLDEDLHYVMDWDILIRIGLASPLSYVPEYMGCIREYPEAKSFSGGGPRIEEIKRILRKHTGLYLPPGYVAYGLDTYRKIWCDWITNRSPSWLGKRVGSLISLACGFWIDRAIRHSQGWYADGWAGSTVQLMVSPPRGRSIIFEGEVPGEVIRGDAMQELAIHLNDLPPVNVALNRGPFVHRVDVPEPLQNKPIRVCVRSSRHVILDPSGETTYRRKGCFLLKSIVLSRGNAPEDGLSEETVRDEISSRRIPPPSPPALRAESA